MTGTVDDFGRALLPILIRHPSTAATIHLEAWVDTGFTGALLLPAAQIASVGLPRFAAIPGGLADGSQFMFTTYTCLVQWFGALRQVEALAGSNRFPLIGVQLLEDFLLTIDYPKRVVTLVPSCDPATPGPAC
jgi:clan AA aspartic protease